MSHDHPEDEIRIDTALLGRVFQRQLRAWLLIGPILLGVLVVLGLFLVPQSFTSSASIAIQQPAASSSSLALLTGQQPGKRYLGILKSRLAATMVERHVGLQQIYGFTTEEEAVEFLMKCVTPTDNAADGLLYIDVTLPGPPKLAPHAATRREVVRQATALAANAYADALHDYYVTSDTDRDTVLLRGADVETHNARAEFNQASARLRRFALRLGRVDPRAAPPPGGAMPSGAVSALEHLYEADAQVETQIRAAEAAQASQRQLVGGQLHNVRKVPGEDPLLSDARSRVLVDRTDLANLRVQFGPDNPQVVLAEQRLRIDQTTLNQQMQGVQNNLTTEQVRGATEIESLRARQASLDDQIAQAQRQLGVSRRLFTQYSQLQTQVELSLEALKATLAEAAKVRLDNVSAQSRMTVVDSAIPSRTGKPGSLILAVICLVLVLLAFAVMVLRDYSTQIRSAAALPPAHSHSSTHSPNGAVVSSLENVEDAEAVEVPSKERG